MDIFEINFGDNEIAAFGYFALKAQLYRKPFLTKWWVALDLTLKNLLEWKIICKSGF